MRPIRARQALSTLIGWLVLAGCSAVPSTTTSNLSSPPITPSGAGSPIATAPSPTPTNPSPTASPRPEPLTSLGLRDAIDAAAIRAHLQQLQGIADANGGNRAAGTAGFDASVEYVASRLEAAGYAVVRQEFVLAGAINVNLIAELRGSNGAEVVMLGAHLDSHSAGPGINDNGTGIMTLLTLAERLPAFERPARTIRFAFWGAEEPGRVGSETYVASLGAEERQRLAAYLNFDILGSPNYIRFVYNDREAAPGSAAITELFTGYFESVGLNWEPIDLTNKSDHAAFSRAGIPTGGLFSGGRELKTDAQAAAFGGTSGAPADPCSDAACDAVANVSDESLDQMADAVAHAIVVLAGETIPRSE